MTVATLPAARHLTPVIITEMEYASDLLRRAEAAITKEFAVLRAGGVQIDHTAASRLSFDLVSMAVQLHMLALQATEMRRAMSMGTCPGGAV